MNDTRIITVGSLVQRDEHRNRICALLGIDPSDERAWRRYIATALQTVMKAPHLAPTKCDPLSVLLAIKDAAALKLELDGALGHAWIVPYRGKAQMQIGYKGMVKMALRSGHYTDVIARVVWSWERAGFRVQYGTEERIDHVVAIEPPEGATFGEESVLGAYALAPIKGGGVKQVFLSRAEINARRARSSAYRYAVQNNRTDTPWHTDYAAMAKKTAIRALAATLELAVEDARALARDAIIDEGREVPPELPRPSEARNDVGEDEFAALLSTQPEEEESGEVLTIEGARSEPAQDRAGGNVLRQREITDVPSEEEMRAADEAAERKRKR